jgi:hypothetical protein
MLIASREALITFRCPVPFLILVGPVIVIGVVPVVAIVLIEIEVAVAPVIEAFESLVTRSRVVPAHVAEFSPAVGCFPSAVVVALGVGARVKHVTHVGAVVTLSALRSAVTVSVVVVARLVANIVIGVVKAMVGSVAVE